MPTNFEYIETTGVSSRETHPISAAYVEPDGQTATNVFQEKYQNYEDVVDQEEISGAVAYDEWVMESDSLNVSLQMDGEKINKTAFASADKAWVSVDDLAVLQHYTAENGPTTVSQLYGLLPKTSTLSVEELRTALQGNKGPFRFTKGGLVYSDEAKLRAVYTIARYLKERGISTIEDVRDWFLLHVPKQDKSLFTASHNLCEFRKLLEQFPHIFVLGKYGENCVSIPHDFPPEAILPQDTEDSPISIGLDDRQVKPDGIESCSASESENDPVTARKGRKRKRKGKLCMSKEKKLLQFYVDTNGPKSMEELHNHLHNLIGSGCYVSSEEFQDVLTFDAGIESFTMTPMGLVSSPVQMIVSFLEREGTSDIAKIYAWLVDSYGEGDFGSTEKAVLNKLLVLSHIFDVGRKGKCISLQPTYVSNRQRIGADGSRLEMNLSAPIYNHLGFLKGSYIKPLWIHVEENGPTNITELLSLVHQKIGLEDIISKEELRKNIKAYIYNMNFAVSKNSDMVGPNEVKQQAAQKVAQFVETSGAKSVAEVWEWFEQHGSNSEKRRLGETEKVFKKTVKEMTSIFKVTSAKNVCISPQYRKVTKGDMDVVSTTCIADEGPSIPKEADPHLIPSEEEVCGRSPAVRGDYLTGCDQESKKMTMEVRYQPEAVSTKKVDEVGACDETVRAIGSRMVLTSYDSRGTESRTECVGITKTYEGSPVSAVTGVDIDSSQIKCASFLSRKGNIRKTDTKFLRHYVEQNGPTTLQQLHSVLHKKIGAENVISLKKLERDLQRRGSVFTFLPSGLVGPNEVRLTAANKIIQFLEMKGPSSIHDVKTWYCQHASKEEKHAFSLAQDTSWTQKKSQKISTSIPCGNRQSGSPSQLSS